MIGALIVLVIASICGLIFVKTTDHLNDAQRYKAICEAEGGQAVGTQFCIVGNEVITIDGIN